MNFGFELRSTARNSPWLLETSWRLRKLFQSPKLDMRRRVVEKGDAVVIEGYPRSANTYACDAFTVAQGLSLKGAIAHGYPIKMGNHFHSSGQFVLAHRYGVPAMLVLREPMAAALSWVVYTKGELGPTETLGYYVRFHEPLIAIRDAFIVAPFEEVTDDFGKSIERLNARFGTEFTPFINTEEAKKTIFEGMESRLEWRERNLGENLKSRSSFPSELKKQMSEKFSAQFDSPDLADLKARASAVYQKLSSPQ